MLVLLLLMLLLLVVLALLLVVVVLLLLLLSVLPLLTPLPSPRPWLHWAAPLATSRSPDAPTQPRTPAWRAPLRLRTRPRWRRPAPRGAGKFGDSRAESLR